MQRRDPQLEKFWRRTISKWKASGRNIRAFCVQHDLSQPNFYAWRRELAKRDAERTAVPKSAARKVNPSPAQLVPLRIVPDAIIEVVLPTGVILRVPGGAEVVAKLITELEAATC